MADLGDAARRMLDPRWTTLMGTVRQWGQGGTWPMGHWPPPVADFGPSVRPLRMQSVLLSSSSLQGPGEEVEQWHRVVLRRSDRAYRLEQHDPGSSTAHLTTISGPDGGFVVSTGTAPRRVDGLGWPFAWITDASSLAATYRIELDGIDEFAGRAVARATCRPRPALSDMVNAGSMSLGYPPGATCELTIDVATGLCLRMATFAGQALVGLRQFLDIEIDADVDDRAFTYVLAPGERFRTHVDDQLDMLRGRGVDVSDLDTNDEVAVQRAVMDLHRRDSEPHRALGGPGGTPRTVSELVAPLGPGPEDPTAARTSIEEALGALADDDRPRADGVERGELLDADAAAGNAPGRHPMLGDQTVVFVLDDVGFVRADEALVEFRIVLSGGGAFPVKGRAVLTESGWRLSYETWAGLQQMGGYRVPPVTGPPDDQP